MDTSKKSEYVPIQSNEYTFIYEDIRFTIITDDALEYLSNSNDTSSHRPPADTHFHMYYELFYIYDGEMKMHFENGTKTICAGELLIISPKCNHKIISNDCKRFTLNINISKSMEPTDFPIFSMIKKFLSNEYLHLENVNALYIPLREIVRSIELEHKISIGLGFHEFITAFTRLANIYLQFYNNSENKKTTLKTENLKYHNLQTLLNRNYNKNISIEDIAKELHLSVRQTNRTINKVYNCGFRELIRMLRMNQAGMLLAYSDMNITEIAQKVGYSSICGFYNAFFRHYKQKPLEYRRKYSVNKQKNIFKENDND